MDTGMPSNNEDTPMQNEETTVTSQSWTTVSPLVTNGPVLSLLRSPNLPSTHFILLKTNASGGALTSENCFVVDISNLQNQNLTLVPAITQATVKPPTEEQGKCFFKNIRLCVFFLTSVYLCFRFKGTGAKLHQNFELAIV